MYYTCYCLLYVTSTQSLLDESAQILNLALVVLPLTNGISVGLMLRYIIKIVIGFDNSTAYNRMKATLYKYNVPGFHFV